MPPLCKADKIFPPKARQSQSYEKGDKKTDGDIKFPELR